MFYFKYSFPQKIKRGQKFSNPLLIDRALKIGDTRAQDIHNTLDFTRRERTYIMQTVAEIKKKKKNILLGTDAIDVESMAESANERERAKKKRKSRDVTSK
jgi:hypothetical protein